MSAGGGRHARRVGGTGGDVDARAAKKSREPGPQERRRLPGVKHVSAGGGGAGAAAEGVGQREGARVLRDAAEEAVSPRGGADLGGAVHEAIAGGSAKKSASAEGTAVTVITAVSKDAIAADLLSFFADRLKVFLKDQGKRPDLIDAVFSLGGQDDLALIVRRVDALDAFLKTDDGTNLLAGVKRAANILGIEEKKDKKSYAASYDLALLKDKEEIALAAKIEEVKQDTVAAINVENFAGAMRALAELRPPVDAFFEKILVNADDPKIRENRLKLLSEIRAATATVADFSKIAG